MEQILSAAWIRTALVQQAVLRAAQALAGQRVAAACVQLDNSLREVWSRAVIAQLVEIGNYFM